MKIGQSYSSNEMIMSSKFETFKNLHHGPGLFTLPNAWNARSAAILQKEGYHAIATSSAAVANSLGYEDGEGMPFTDYLFIIKRILACIKVPLTVDMEMGYGRNNDEIYANIKKLTDLGVVGINLEDSVIKDSTRSLQDAATFARKIEFLRSKLSADKLQLFINIRCDTYILNVADKRKVTDQRLKIYNSSGADGIFLPCITDERDIQNAVSTSVLPINVMCIPGLPDFSVLNELGVKRASTGPFLFNKVYDSIGMHARATTTEQSFAPIL